jgi:hypothetical protein
MSPKKTTVPEVVLAPLNTNQDEILLKEARSQKKGRLLAQHHKMRSWTKKSTTLKPYTNMWRIEEKRCFNCLSCKRRSMKQL